jgi:hypothetical protein
LERVKWRGLRVPRLGKFEMKVFGLPLRAALRLAVAVALALALALPADSAMAAPPGFGHQFRFGGGQGGMQRFNVDPAPCGAPGPRMRGRGDCPSGQERHWPRDGRNAPRGPGSNAFGLQFDMGGY